jgi:MFS family permease
VSNPTPPLQTAMTRRALIAVALSVAVVGLTTTAITVGARGVADDLGVSLRTLGWIVNAYLLAAASLALVGGRMGDVVGRARTFLLGLVVIVVGSLCGALAPGAELLIVARAVQGVGAALALPAGIEVIAAFSSDRAASRAFSVRSVTYACAFAIGPLVGGLLTDYLSWRLIFALAALLSVAAIVVGLPLLHHMGRGGHRPTRDWRGAVLAAGASFLFVLAAERSRVWGLDSWMFWATVLVGVVFVGAFVAVERSAEHPLIHPALLRDRVVAGANIATFGASLGMVGLLYFFNVFAQSAAQFDATVLAVLMALTPFIISMIAFAQLSHWLAKRLGFRGPAMVGMGLMVVGFALLGRTTSGSTRVDLALPLLLCGVGAGIANAGLIGPAVLGLPTGRLNEAAGIVSLTRFLGSAFALALGTSAYLSASGSTTAATTAIDPDGAPMRLGGEAFRAALTQLDNDLQGPFLAAVRDDTAAAFASTMQLTAVVLCVVWVLSAYLLRPRATARAE